MLVKTASDRLEEYLLRSGLRPGDMLPSEREFTALLGVSRTAVREAAVHRTEPWIEGMAAGSRLRLSVG